MTAPEHGSLGDCPQARSSRLKTGTLSYSHHLPSTNLGQMGWGCTDKHGGLHKQGYTRWSMMHNDYQSYYCCCSSSSSFCCCCHCRPCQCRDRRSPLPSPPQSSSSSSSWASPSSWLSWPHATVANVVVIVYVHVVVVVVVIVIVVVVVVCLIWHGMFLVVLNMSTVSYCTVVIGCKLMQAV